MGSPGYLTMLLFPSLADLHTSILMIPGPRYSTVFSSFSRSRYVSTLFHLTSLTSAGPSGFDSCPSRTKIRPLPFDILQRISSKGLQAAAICFSHGFGRDSIFHPQRRWILSASLLYSWAPVGSKPSRLSIPDGSGDGVLCGYTWTGQ